MKHLAVMAAVSVTFIVPAVNGYVNYEYYKGTWDSLPDFDTLTPVETGLVVNFDISRHPQSEEGFGYRFTAYIDIPTPGLYTFYTNSDDGSRLYIDDVLVVDNDGLHGPQLKSKAVSLTEGSHLIEVLFFEKTGGNVLSVQYRPPTGGRQFIPDDLLSPVSLPVSDKACYPLPPDGARILDPLTLLRWSSPSLPGQLQYIVYFGTDPNLPESCRVSDKQDQTMFDPFAADPIPQGQTWYWRVDAYEPDSTNHVGDVWEFTTRYGLVAMYDFEVDPNDITGNGHGGTYVGKTDPNIVADPMRGNVLQLNAGGQSDAQYVEIGSVGISGSSPRTIAGWAKASTTAIPNWTSLFGFSPANGSGNSYFDVERDDSGRIVLHVHGWEKPFLPVDTQWHHYAATYDGVTIRWYLDGTLVGVNDDRLLDTMDEFRIGARKSHQTYFPGFLDDIAVWDYALSPEEVEQLVLRADFDSDKDVDVRDLGSLVDNWLASTVIPGSIQPVKVLEDFEKYAIPFPPIGLGWFVYLSDSRTFKSYPDSSYPCTLETGQPEGPYGVQKVMKVHYQFPVYAPADDWLVLGHYVSADDAGEVDMAKCDEIRFRVKYHADNTDDVGFFFQVADEPPQVIEREAFRVGPFPTTDDPADPNQWHEIVIDLHNDDTIDWQGSYTSVEGVHNLNAILLSIVNSSGQQRTGTLYFDDIRLIDYTPDCQGLPPTDINSDCVVDNVDFAVLASEWLRQTQ